LIEELLVFTLLTDIYGNSDEVRCRRCWLLMRLPLATEMRLVV